MNKFVPIVLNRTSKWTKWLQVLLLLRCLTIMLLCFYYRISNLLNSRADYRQNFYSTSKIHSAENLLSESLFSLYFYISKRVRNLTSIFVLSRLKTPLFRKGATGVKCNTNSRDDDDWPMNSPNLNKPHISKKMVFSLEISRYRVSSQMDKILKLQ